MIKPIALMTSLVCFAALPAVAADNSQSYIEEIRVTALKREQALTEVPVSMTVLDEAALELKGFSRFDDIAFAAANVAITNPSGSRAVQFTVRGITGQTFFPGAESATGIFLDGVYLNNPSAQNFDLLDVARIEILRGPQGTLYGKNAAAGAINIVSQRPDAEQEVSLLAEYGNFSSKRVRGNVRGQLGDGVFGAFGAAFHKRDGFQDNPFLGTGFDDADSWNARGALRYAKGGPLEVNVAVDFMREHVVPAALDGTPEDRASSMNRIGFEKRDVFGGTITVDYEVSDTLLLTSITALRDYDTVRANDDDGATFDAYYTTGNQDTQQFSQEIRLTSGSDSPLQWLAGVYYLTSELNEHSVNFLFPDPLFELLTGLTCTNLFTFQLIQAGFTPDQAAAFAAGSCVDAVADHIVTHDATTAAAFGQLSYDFAKSWRLTAGLRGSWEDKDFRLQQPGPGGALFLLPGVDATFDRSDSAIDPMASLMFFATDSTNLYATVAKGSKSGGFNTGAVGDANQLANTNFDQESLVNYELGMKTSLLGGRLDMNLAAFYVDYEDLQVFRIEPNAQGVPTSRITNVGEATSKGIELDIVARPVDGLTLRGSFGYLDARYKDYTQCGQDSAGSLTDCSGNHLTNAPDRTANINALYSIPLNDSISLQLNGEWSYRGDVYYDVFNTDGAFQPSFSIVNASIAIGDVADKWTVSLWGTNLTDKDYITIGIQGFGGIAINTLGPPRQYGLRVATRF